MAASRIAPTLVYAHKPRPLREIATSTDSAIRAYPAADAWRELRALLEVAKAAEHYARLVKHAFASGNQTCSAEWDIVDAVDRLRRASRASGPRSRKGGR